jgi:hypothetical protein
MNPAHASSACADSVGGLGLTCPLSTGSHATTKHGEPYKTGSGSIRFAVRSATSRSLAVQSNGAPALD